jgi:hypothetical protein
MSPRVSNWTACAQGGCPGHINLSGSPGRCPECSFHVATQGHRDCCSGTAPIEPPSPYTDSFIENMRRRKADEAREIPDEMWRYFGHTPPGTATTSRPRPADVAQPGRNPAYVAAAIRAELDKLAATREGSRNHTLYTVACNIFEFVKGGHADETAALAEFERIAAAIGLESREIRATLKSAWGHVSPRDVPAPRGAA